MIKKYQKDFYSMIGAWYLSSTHSNSRKSSYLPVRTILTVIFNHLLINKHRKMKDIASTAWRLRNCAYTCERENNIQKQIPTGIQKRYVLGPTIIIDKCFYIGMTEQTRILAENRSTTLTTDSN